MWWTLFLTMLTPHKCAGCSVCFFSSLRSEARAIRTFSALSRR